HSTRIAINRDARSLLTPCLQGVLIPRTQTAKQQGAHHWHMRMVFFSLFFSSFFLGGGGGGGYKNFC
ncbi:hypothetical protein N308_10477, partial [Struthio camelus australis]